MLTTDNKTYASLAYITKLSSMINLDKINIASKLADSNE